MKNQGILKMKQFWKFGIIGFFLAAGMVSQGNAYECEFARPGEGRAVCNSNKTGLPGPTGICFPCPVPKQAILNGLCTVLQPNHCPNRCASDFLESCNRTCGAAAKCHAACTTAECKKNCYKSTVCPNCDNEQACNTSCEEYEKKNCMDSCTAKVLDGC